MTILSGILKVLLIPNTIIALNFRPLAALKVLQRQ
jgi:hypothetical protein